MLRRGEDNPGVGFRCLKRDTPLKIVMRWASSVCPGVPQGSLVALKDELSRVGWHAWLRWRLEAR